jgi:hypothetical protein
LMFISQAFEWLFCFIKTKSSMCSLCAGVIVCVNKCGKFSDL